MRQLKKKMQLKKITDKGKTGSFYVGNSEILTICWNSGTRPDFYAFDSSKVVRKVDKEYFALSTVGIDYKCIEKQLPSSIESYQFTKDEKGNRYFCFYQEGIVFGFDAECQKNLEWSIDDVGQGHAIYDIKYQYPDFLWLAFPTGQTVTQISISERKETFAIGEYTWDEKYEPLSYPESIFVEGKLIYIPNMGNNKLFRLNDETKDLELIETFEEKLWQYGETEVGTFILTDTGIYELENKKPTA